MKTFTFYLMRHAVTDFINGEPAVVGSTDLPLSAEGAEAAKNASVILNEAINPQAVFCSPLLRAKQTARLLFREKEILVAEGIKEYCFGDLEGTTFKEIFNGGEFDWAELFKRINSAGGAEVPKEFLTRICASFAKIIESCIKSEINSAAIISHGFAMMHLMSIFTYPKLDNIYEWSCENLAGFVLKTDTALWMRDHALETKGVILNGVVDMFDTI